MEILPKIFISYSWTSPSHESWVVNLAEKLTSDGVIVVLDKWDLKEGHDKYAFMENMVTSSDISRVLIILDKKYSEKADSRLGGVGTETQIISPEIYSHVSQEKFIPIVSEKDENNNPYFPKFLSARIYIDLSESQHFEENYEKLLRNIYQRPAYEKPKIGKAPSYLFEESSISHKTTSMSRSFGDQINNNPKRINSLLRDFLEEFFNDLKSYSIPFSERNTIELGKEIYDNIHSYTPLRDSYINLVDKLTKSDIDFDVEIIIKFFEKLPILFFSQEDGPYSNHQFDNYRFITHELFLYTIMVSLKNENYNLVEDLLFSNFFFKDKYDIKREPKRFDQLYNYINIFDAYHKEAFSTNLISPMAQLFIKRIPEGIYQIQLVDADLLCHYIAELENLRWFPITYIYRSRTERSFDFFDRLISKRHFDKVKTIFNVNEPSELKEKIKLHKESDTGRRQKGYNNSFDKITPIFELIEIEKIGTIK